MAITSVSSSGDGGGANIVLEWLNLFTIMTLREEARRGWFIVA